MLLPKTESYKNNSLDGLCNLSKLIIQLNVWEILTAIWKVHGKIKIELYFGILRIDARFIVYKFLDSSMVFF